MFWKAQTDCVPLEHLIRKCLYVLVWRALRNKLFFLFNLDDLSVLKLLKTALQEYSEVVQCEISKLHWAHWFLAQKKKRIPTKDLLLVLHRSGDNIYPLSEFHLDYYDQFYWSVAQLLLVWIYFLFNSFKFKINRFVWTKYTDSLRSDI